MLRRAVMKVVPMRSGGHEHPDFPFVGFYKHKRIISPFESNLWVYDGLNPEYLVDIMAPQYSYGFILTRNLFYAWLFPVLLGWVLALICYSSFKRPFVPSYITSDEDPVRRFFKKLKHENYVKKFKHPLGHSNTYQDEGWDSSATSFILNRYKL